VGWAGGVLLGSKGGPLCIWLPRHCLGDAITSSQHQRHASTLVSRPHTTPPPPQTALVEVTPARPVVVEEFADFRGLGRIALRDGGSTVAVGVITRVLAEK
jgi:elongation factor 1 alpha-like protein